MLSGGFVSAHFLFILNINNMRKITSLLTLLFLCVVGASAQITSVSDIVETGTYTISSVDRGSWCYNEADPTNLYSTTVAKITVDATSEAQQWKFIKTAEEGQFQIQNVATSLYLQNKEGEEQNSDGWTLGETAGTFTVQQDGNYFHILQTNTGDWINFSNGWHYGVTGAWTSADEGNNFTITKVADTEATEVSVTYIVSHNGEKLDEAVVTQFVGDAATLPAANQKGYTSYTYDVETITASTTTVNVTATFTLPFTISASYDDATWYYLALRGNYPTYSADGDPNITLPASYTNGDANAQWAFIGNPYVGFTIINKAAGADKMLSSEDPSADSSAGGDTHATMEAKGGKTYQVWYPVYSSAAADGKEGFFLNNALNYALNKRATTSLDYWTGGKDIGSTFQVIEVPDDYLATLIGNYATTYSDTAVVSVDGPFQMTKESYDAIKAEYDDLVKQGTCTLAEYEAFVATTSEAVIVYPETGYYRIKSSGNRGAVTYAAVGTISDVTGLRTYDADHAILDASTIFKLTKVEDGVYKLSSQGAGVAAPTGYNVPFLANAAEDEGDNFEFSSVNVATGLVAIHDATLDSYGYLHEAGWGVNKSAIVKWETGTPSSWYVEEVSTLGDLEVALDTAADGKFYTTLNLPFGATVNGAKAYVVTKSTEGEWLVLGEGTTTVAANTPVVLVADSALVTVTVNPEATTDATGNVLTGTNLAAAIQTTDLVLGEQDEHEGFYTTTSETLAANKAYLANTDEAVTGLPFYYPTVGISSATTTTLQGAKVYDLQGRRVVKAQNGLYIVNGKKVLVK